MVTITVEDCKTKIKEWTDRMDFVAAFTKNLRDEDILRRAAAKFVHYQTQIQLWQAMLEKLEGQKNG